MYKQTSGYRHHPGAATNMAKEIWDTSRVDEVAGKHLPYPPEYLDMSMPTHACMTTTQTCM